MSSSHLEQDVDETLDPLSPHAGGGLGWGPSASEVDAPTQALHPSTGSGEDAGDFEESEALDPDIECFDVPCDLAPASFDRRNSLVPTRISFFSLIASLVMHAIVIVILVRAGILRLPATFSLQGGGGSGEPAEVAGDGLPPQATEPLAAPSAINTAEPPSIVQPPMESPSGELSVQTAKSPMELLSGGSESPIIGVPVGGDADPTPRFHSSLPAAFRGGPAGGAPSGGSAAVGAHHEGVGAAPGTGGGAVGLAGIPRGSSSNRPPRYPADARRNRIEGTVGLMLEVLEDGSVGHISVEVSSGYELLDQAAVDGLRGWHFTPASVDGRAVRSQLAQKVEFVMQK